MGGACNTYGGLLWRPERNRPLGRPMNRWLDDIKMGLQGVGWKGTDWMALAQDRDSWGTLENAVMNLRVP